MNSKSPSKKRLSFLEEYERLTLLENSYPLPYVINNIKDNCIELNADRIRLSEWDAIIGALRKDNSLKYLALKSCWQQSAVKGESKKSGLAKRRPPIRTRSVLLKLARSLKDFLSGNTCLECLVLQNLPFREEEISLIALGLSKVRSLRSLSMEQCPIKDAGLYILLESIKRSTSIVSVDFTKCGLTSKSAETLASTIKFQGTQRHNEAWQASLRYRKPDLDHMQGLRRITMCNNKIGDDGVKILSDTLKDDLWLKALDMQQCSISTDGATILKNTLKFNSTLVVLDLRRNPAISYNCLRSVIEMVMVQAGGEHSEFPWINNKDVMKNETANISFVKRTSTSKKPRVSRRKSLEERKPRCHKTNEPSKNKRSNTARSNIRKHQQMETGESDVTEHVHTYNHQQYDGLDVSKDLLYGLTSHQVDEKRAMVFTKEVEYLKTELEHCKMQLSEEKEKNRRAEREMASLKQSNDVLTHSVEYYKMQLKEMEKESKKSMFDFKIPDLSQADFLENEGALESIESSFKQFQQFLDMLKNLGLTDVYTNFSKPENEEKP